MRATAMMMTLAIPALSAPASASNLSERVFAASVLQAEQLARESARKALDPVRVRIAVEMDHADEIRRWVDAGELSIDAQVPASTYPDGLAILILAAREGSLKTARFLISRRANLDAETNVGETALMLACFFPDSRSAAAPGPSADDRAHEQIARELVAAGAKLDVRAGNFTALGYAAYAGHAHLIAFLLDRGALVDGGRDGALTALMMASIQGHKDIAKLLLLRGADAKLRNPRGHDSLQLAERHQRKELLPMLRCALSLGPGERFAERCGSL